MTELKFKTGYTGEVFRDFLFITHSGQETNKRNERWRVWGGERKITSIHDLGNKITLQT